MTKNYNEFKEQVTEEQKNLSYDEVKEKLKARSEFLVELDNLPAIKHIWIDRGAKMTCENAGHTWHEVWKKAM